MKGRWYVNWLVVITVLLLFTSLGTFAISIKDTVGIKKCAYGDNFDDNCICNSDGEVVCEEESMQSIENTEFISKNLNYSYEFLSYFDVSSSQKEITFVDISQTLGILKITVELPSYCNENSEPAKQIGFYKGTEEGLVLTTATNLVSESYNRTCVVEGTFSISTFTLPESDTFEIIYQDEYGSSFAANSCLYGGYIRNSGDVYNSIDGCSICSCRDGENVCEEQDSCL